MLYYVLAALLTAAVYAGVVWYFASQIHFLIQDQQYSDPYYKWEQVKNYLETPLIVFYLFAAVWFVVAGMRFGFFGRISNFYDAMSFSAGSLLKAGGFALALVLLAVLPAAVCLWLEGWLERNYKNNDRDADESSWRRANLNVVS